MKAQLSHTFEDIISVDNLLEAWREFVRGKRNKRDVQEFSLHLMDNILSLHQDLVTLRYHHGGYEAFNIFDPKPRKIHKASVRDRLLHHAIYRVLYPFFDRVFVADSYSCRNDRGTHRVLDRLRSFARQVSKNNTRTCWVLKCDIRKFFENIDHAVLLGILKQHMPDVRVIQLLSEVIGSFSSRPGKGLPLGNLTSQLFVNIYMTPFDQFMKHQFKERCYVRYADDFAILSADKSHLEEHISTISYFLQDQLKLELHPQKVSIKTLVSGVDFLGWVHFPDHRVLRTATKKRMLKKVATSFKPETLQSYLGLLSHGNTHRLRRKLLETKSPHCCGLGSPNVDVYLASSPI